MKEGKAYRQDPGANSADKAECKSHPNDKEANSPKLPKRMNQISLVHFRRLLSSHSSFPVFVSFATPGWNVVLPIPNIPQTRLSTIRGLWSLAVTLSLSQ